MPKPDPRRSSPDWETRSGTTIKHKGLFITSVNLLEFYSSSLIELDGRTVELMCGREMIKDVFVAHVHDGTSEDMVRAAEGPQPDEYPTEEEAMNAAKKKIDEGGTA